MTDSSAPGPKRAYRHSRPIRWLVVCLVFLAIALIVMVIALAERSWISAVLEAACVGYWGSSTVDAVRLIINHT